MKNDILDNGNELVASSTGAYQAQSDFTWQGLVLKHAQVLLHATEANLDQLLDSLLQDVGELAGADRSYLFQLDVKHDTMSNTHEWCRIGISAEKANLQNVPNTQLPWWIDRLRANQEIFIRSLDELPPEATAERAILEPQGIQSLAVFPVASNGHLLGFFGFDSVRQQRSWSPKDLNLLSLVAEILGGVLKKHRESLDLSRELKRQRQRGDDIEKLFRTLFDGSQHFMCYLDLSGHIIEVNPAAQSISGTNSEYLIGELFWKCPWCPPSPEAQSEWRKVLSSAAHGDVINIRVPIHNSAESRLVDFSISPVRRVDAEINGLLVEGRDITDYEKTRHALQQAEQRWKFALEGADQGVWEWDIATSSVFFSDRWLAIVGYQPGELPASYETWAERVYPGDLSRVLQELQEYSGGKTPVYRTEYRIRHRDGSYKWCLDQGLITLRDAAGKPTRMVGTLTDITSRKLAKQSLRERSDELLLANAQLAKAGRMKDEFLASMSHELRTPLTGILSLSEILIDGVYGKLDQRQTKYLRLIEESGRHLLDLINDILDVAKIESGQLALEQGPQSVDELCAASLRLVKEMAFKKNQRITVTQNPTGMIVEADGRRMKQILVNLLGNAVKFTGNDGRIELRAIACEGLIRFEVEDSGIGIAEEQMKKLFQPFVQLDSKLSRHYGGSGLGLALVRQLAELHGGSVEVRSEVGKGSTFSVLIPWAERKVTPPLPKTGITIEARTLLAKDQNNQTILLAEDNPVNVEAVKGYFEAHGYNVILAGNGEEAVEAVTKYHPSIVLMDIQMPKMDGIEATQIIRRLTDPALRNIPIIALTALAMPGDRERCLSAGCNGYFPKPVRMGELLKFIRATKTTDNLAHVA